jgi:hypothetical protein
MSEIINLVENRGYGLGHIAGRQDQRDRDSSVSLDPAKLTGVAEVRIVEAV